MGKPKIPTKILAGTCSQRCCDASCFPKTVGDLCSNPLKGQTIAYADQPTFPSLLPPHLFNTGGKMSGAIYNFLMMASHHYEFKLDFNPGVLAGMTILLKNHVMYVTTEFYFLGRFVPQNRTFTPGKYAMVCLIST